MSRRIRFLLVLCAFSFALASAACVDATGPSQAKQGTLCDVNNPNILINNRGNIGFDSPYQIRGGFSYRLPYDVQFSGTVREATGLPQQRTFTVTTAIVPGLTQVNQFVQIAPRGEFRYPWQNLVDLRLTKIFRLPNGVRVEPTVDLFNVFNNNAVTNAVTAVGSSLGRPSAIVMGRLLRVGGHVTF